MSHTTVVAMHTSSAQAPALSIEGPICQLQIAVLHMQGPVHICAAQGRQCWGAETRLSTCMFCNKAPLGNVLHTDGRDSGRENTGGGEDAGGGDSNGERAAKRAPQCTHSDLRTVVQPNSTGCICGSVAWVCFRPRGVDGEGAEAGGMVSDTNRMHCTGRVPHLCNASCR